jgi:hypothetical protein
MLVILLHFFKITLCMHYFHYSPFGEVPFVGILGEIFFEGRNLKFLFMATVPRLEVMGGDTMTYIIVEVKPRFEERQ